ncbi:MAG: type IV pilin protein, partial [Alphaproteobacteria bacterium]
MGKAGLLNGAVMRRQRGFTLIELMVVVTIVGILALIGVPQYRAYVLVARLEEAKPMLESISARMRMDFLETGEYCCQGSVRNEDVIIAELGVPLQETGDFCFMITCVDPDICSTVSHNGFITA